jgi:hypothetical protein
MQVAFFSNYIYNPHFETELELIQEHLHKGDTVTHFVCERDLLSCDFNAGHDYLRCSFCIRKRNEGIQLLQQKTHYKVIRISPEKTTGKESLRLDFTSIEDLKNYRFENFEIGYAALSSLVTWTRDPEPDLVQYAELLNNMIRTAFFVYQETVHWLSQHPTDRYYIFNGRFAVNRALLRACEKAGVPAIIHERGNDYKHYELYDKVMPHDIAAFSKMVRSAWNNSTDSKESREKIAASFYDDRFNGKEQGWFSYTDVQQKNLLPEGWNMEDENIVIFNSSEDEFVAIGEEWSTELYNTQLSILSLLANDTRLNPVKLWLRMHPNMAQMAGSYLEKYDILKGSAIQLIPPESTVSTYALMMSGSKILTFGSTIGIEATYWGKVSILYGKSFYMNLDVTHNPADYENLLLALVSEDLEAKSKTNTLPFAYYLSRFGIPYRIYNPELLAAGTFRGKQLDKSFNLEFWKDLSEKRGLHWLYNKINTLTRRRLKAKYV